MDISGLWRLFFLTGLPEVYLAAKEEEQPPEEPSVPAFGRERDEENML